MNISPFHEPSECKGPEVIMGYVADESKTIESFVDYLDDDEPCASTPFFSRRHLPTRFLFFLGVALFFVGTVGTLFLLDFPVTIQLHPQTVRQHGEITLTLSPNGSQAVRQLTTTGTVSRTFPATGSGQHPATSAVGSLTWYNATAMSYSLPAGLQLSLGNGQNIQTTTATFLAAAGPPTVSQATVSAQMRPGSSGNIGAQMINVQCPCDIGSQVLPSGVSVTNLTPFYGGEDMTVFKVVTTKDINLTEASKQSRQRAILALDQQRGKDLQVGEPFCRTLNRTNPPVGNSSQRVQVTSTTTCSVETYNTSQGTQQATMQWDDQIQKILPLWDRVSPIHTDLTSVTQRPNGIVIIKIEASGTWRLHISENVLSSLKTQLAGKTHQQALQILASLKNIECGPVQQFGGGWFHFPHDVHHISIQISNEQR